MASKTVSREYMTQTDDKGNILRQPRELAEEKVNFRWWVLDEKEMAPAIAGVIKFIRDHQGNRLTQLTRSQQLYGNMSDSVLGPTGRMGKSATASTPMTDRMSYNLVSSVIDTLESKMAKNKVVPTYVTNGGDWKAQRKAKDLTKFTQGLFYAQNVHKKSIHAWGDAAVWGDGFIQVGELHDKVHLERVLPHELFVDTIESINAHPQQLHRVRFMDRDIAMELFPELEEEIEKVAPANYEDMNGQATAVDIIPVTESWHLKSGPKTKDGLHVYCIGDGAISDEYDKDYFPFAHVRYCKRKLGWYGQGAPERLQNIQREINRSMILKQKSLHMMSSFKILVEKGGGTPTQHFDNEIGTILFYNQGSTPPQYVSPPATNPELQQWIDALVQYGYQQEGVSRMSTTGEAPLGVESGKALRTLTQINDDRFLFMQQEMEDFTLEIARQSVNVVKDIYARTKKYEVVFPDTRFMETVDWKNIQLENEEFVLKAYPTSSLSDDITGRLSEIQELAQAGMVSPKSARRLMDMPDVEMSDSLANAAEDRLHQIFEKMLEDKEPCRFEPGFHDATLASQLALQYINYAEFYNCPDENVQLVRDYLDQINTEIQNAQMMQQQMNAMNAMQGGAPQAAPQAQPQSNLIPNVPGEAQ